MIKAEELKELYKNGAIVYGVYREYDDYGHYDNIIEEQDLADGYYIDVYEKYGITGILDDLKNTYDNLFETKSEAEFYAKYGNIEKTVKMPVPPTWEEIINNKIDIINIKPYVIAIDFPNRGDCGCIALFLIKNSKYYSIKITYEFIEDNYYKILDKMVELWREEE